MADTRTEGQPGPAFEDDTLIAEARDLQQDTVRLRRDLHAHPELGLQLPRTQERILESLDGLGVDLRTGESTTSVVGVLEGALPGPTTLLRADMDALPMPEDTGLDFASTVDLTMHACGHDAHVAMLVTATRLLAARRDRLAGRVVLMFQPGEEGDHGARHMLDEGLLDAVPDHPVEHAFTLHISSSIPSGMVLLKGGPMLASADTVRITVNGRGGHASMPHLALDPIPIACEIVTAIQASVTRRVDVFDPAVVTIARITAGTTSNVIPETAEVYGTIRAVSEKTRATVHAALQRLASGIAEAHDASATVEIESGYPVTVNDPGAAGFAADVARDLLGDPRVIMAPSPIMGAEDFSYVLQRVPGAMAMLGAMPAGAEMGKVAPNHSNRFVIDEGAMAAGAAVYAAVAMRRLAPTG